MTNFQLENTEKKEYSLLFILAMLWGGSFTLIKVALESYPPMTIVTSRLIIGGLIILSIAIAINDKFPKNRRGWLELAVQGILQGGLPFYLITWAEKYIDSSVAGVLNSTPPMLVFIITVFLLHSARFDWSKFVGIIIGMSGVAIIALYRTDSSTEVENKIWAVFAVLAASCSYAVGAIYGKRFAGQSVFVTGGTSLMLAGLITLPATLVLDQPFSLSPSLSSTVALLALTLLSTALASVIFFRLLKTLGSLATASNGYLRALFSMVLGALFLGEKIGAHMLVAAIFIFCGVFLVTGQFRLLVLDRQTTGETKNE